MKTNPKILAAIQATARHFIAVKLEQDELNRYVKHMCEQYFPSEKVTEREIEFHIRDTHIQAELATRWEVALFRGPDGRFRVVSLALPHTVTSAKERINDSKIPNPGMTCAWCRLEEKYFDGVVLTAEADIYGAFVPGVRLHPQCARTWKRLRILAEQDEMPEAPKKSKRELV